MAVALLAVTLKWAETRWIGAFFRLHTGPGGLACAVTPPPGQVWANSEHCKRTSRAGSNGLDRGSQVLGVRLNRYRDRLSHQRSTARLENCPNTPTSKAKGSPYVRCGYGAFYWQSGTSTFMLSLRIDGKCGVSAVFGRMWGHTDPPHCSNDLTSQPNIVRIVLTSHVEFWRSMVAIRS